jgi:hypothetical protein
MRRVNGVSMLIAAMWLGVPVAFAQSPGAIVRDVRAAIACTDARAK